MFKRKPKTVKAVSPEAASKLADSMSKLADTLERFQDPVLWQKAMKTALDTGLTLPLVQALPGPTPSATLMLADSAKIHLSDVDREQLATRVYDALKPQLEELKECVAKALKEMPSTQLRSLAEKIEAGEMPEIKRRRGCVYVAAGGEEYYLGL